MAVLNLLIPEEVRFADLRLSRDPQTLDVEFDVAVMDRVFEASGLDTDDIDMEVMSKVLVAWYEAGQARGEPVDPVCEVLLAEMEAQETFGLAQVMHGSSTVQ